MALGRPRSNRGGIVMALAPINWTNRNAYSQDDAAIRTILGEAGNQGATGQLAVANVIQNRLKAGTWGSTVNAIVAPKQFNGFDANTAKGSPAWNAAASAWEQAKAGNDITGGALYFANPGASSASWAKALNNSNALQIGDHYFTNNTNGTPFEPGKTISTGNGVPESNAPDAANQSAAWYDIPAAIDNAIATFEAGSKNLFVRGAAILVGIIVLAAGLWFLANHASDGKLNEAALTLAAA